MTQKELHNQIVLNATPEAKNTICPCVCDTRGTGAGGGENGGEPDHRHCQRDPAGGPGLSE